MRTSGWLLTAVIGLAACGSDAPAQGAAEQSWLGASPANYAYTLTRYCECDGAPRRITVENGGVVAAVDIATQAPLTNLANVPTIDDLFGWIDEANEVEATYDPGLGYPVAVTLERSKIPVDGGQEFHVTDFELH